MFFNKAKKKSGYVKSKTPEARKKQKAAIAAYYAKKEKLTKKKKQTITAIKKNHPADKIDGVKKEIRRFSVAESRLVMRTYYFPASFL